MQATHFVLMMIFYVLIAQLISTDLMMRIMLAFVY